MRKDPLKTVLTILGFALVWALLAVLLIGITGFFEVYCIEVELSEKYEREIFPEASQEINSVVNYTQNLSSDVERLSAISNYIQDDFVWLLRNPSFKYDDTYRSTFFSLVPPLKTPGDRHYYSDSNGLRVIRDGNYANNPYCIAYYHAGACGEHAVLANLLANMSGIEARRVGDPSGYHGWVEVKVGDEWYFYDPTFLAPLNATQSWFAPTRLRNNNSVIADAACVFVGNEDITHHYPPYGGLNITGISPFDRFSINWERNGDQYYCPLNGSDSAVRLNLTPKKYRLHANRLFVFSYEQEFEIKDGETVNLRVFA